MRSPTHSAQLGTVATLAAAALFGTTGTVLVNAPTRSDAYSVGAVRLLVGGLTLLCVAVWPGRSRSRRPNLAGAVVGALGVAAFQLCYFLAVERTGVAMGTVVTIGSGPVMGGLIAAGIERRRPSARWSSGTAVSVAGVVLLGLAGRSVTVAPSGIALAVGAGLGWAVFASVGKRQIERGVDSSVIMAVMFCGGALLLAPLLAAHSPAWLTSGRGVLVAAYLGVATVGVAYTLYGYALRHLDAPTVITLTLLEPITAAVLGVVVVHERIRPLGWLGIAFVLGGLMLTTRGTTAGDPVPTATVAM